MASTEDSTEGRVGVQLFELPKQASNALADILDFEDNWHQLGELISLRANDIALIAQSASKRGVSPSSELFRVLAAHGYTVDHLYGFLAKMRLVRAQKIIEEHVHEEYKEFFNPDTYRANSESSEETTPNRTAATSVSNRTAATMPCNSDRNCQTSMESDQTDHLHATLSSTLAVPYEELKQATENFSSKYILGKGGYGVVYRAEWKHTTVAVKRIASEHKAAGKGASSAGEKERWRQSLVEMRSLALYRHDHILPLYGYALDGPEPLLVYQFMGGGSFEDRLQRRNGHSTLTWQQRVEIVLGTSRALHYLHAQIPQPLIHGDVKTGNILLDVHLVPRLGDFGLSRYGHMHLPSGAPPLIASHVKGTLAYLPPEFLCHKHLSTKLDVFSLGVVFMESATGKRAYSADRQPEALANFVLQVSKGRGENTMQMSDLVDGTVPSDPDNGCRVAMALLNMGVLCCAAQPDERPDISELVKQLRELAV